MPTSPAWRQEATCTLEFSSKKLRVGSLGKPWGRRNAFPPLPPQPYLLSDGQKKSLPATKTALSSTEARHLKTRAVLVRWEGGSETEFSAKRPGHSCVYKQMACEEPLALGVNWARESAAFLCSTLSGVAERTECSFCGEQGASSLQTDTVIFITV